MTWSPSPSLQCLGCATATALCLHWRWTSSLCTRGKQDMRRPGSRTSRRRGHQFLMQSSSNFMLLVPQLPPAPRVFLQQNLGVQNFAAMISTAIGLLGSHWSNPKGSQNRISRRLDAVRTHTRLMTGVFQSLSKHDPPHKHATVSSQLMLLPGRQSTWLNAKLHSLLEQPRPKAHLAS